MTKVKTFGIYAFTLILIGATFYFVDAPVLSANTENNTDYSTTELDSLSEDDKDAIIAAKEKMKSSTN